MKKLLVICGATASGKTDLAVKCAQKLGTEIISADSQLVYKGLDIGTAKPTETERGGVVHHLIDVVSPLDKFSVFDFGNLAEPIVDRLLGENKTPIVCGGTGFYINTLLFNLGYGGTPADESVREKYTRFLEENGKDALFDKLKQVDGETAAKLHKNDTKRVIRALEIYESSGKKKSEQRDGLKKKRDYVAFAVDYKKEELYERISERVDRMFDMGLVDEVKSLLSSGVDENSQCMQAIGYKEVVFGLKNGDMESTMRDIIKLNTRHYAKRQITFFKKLPELIWLEPKENLADTILEIYDRY